MDDLKPWASMLERLCWSHTFLCFLTQVSSELAFPADGIVLGFWGVYCAFTLHSRAIFGFISFTALSFILDIVFCAQTSGQGGGSATFATIVFIMSMFLKLPALWYASRIFSALGGAASLDAEASYQSGSPSKKGRRGDYAFE